MNNMRAKERVSQSVKWEQGIYKENKRLYSLSYHMYEHPVVSWKLSANSVENSGSLHEIIVSENKDTKHNTFTKHIF